MTATLLAFALGAVLGIVAGAMTLDRYHERQRVVAVQRHGAAEAERDIVRAELARSQSLADALSREIAILKAQRSQAEALHAERIRRTLTEAAKWN